ncbi:hypothetical protein [Bartonella sp. HY406]|uniref:hypothetical protein n=1 Tax=Bartonella sp. HY406 TaxID=2979331 RepID=UPI0021C8F947|nr:hypothetical protein [Bartonella sp. HY406]UXN02946.1 hypothetical protein N6B01_10780 [Bartonella sp. HY406]
MTVISKKLFDADENALEQSNQNALAQVLSSSTTGSQLHIVGDFGNGSYFTGTNLDDTVTITGNLLGSTPLWNNNGSNLLTINLLNGNDTVNVKGETIVGEKNSLNIYGQDGDKNIILGNKVENIGGYFEVAMFGSGNYQLAIKGGLHAEGVDSSTTNSFSFGNVGEHGYKSDIAISGDVVAQNNGSNFIYMDSDISKLFIGGDLRAEGGNNQFTFLGEKTEFTLLGALYATGAFNTLGLGSHQGYFTLGSILADNGDNMISIGYSQYLSGDGPFYMTVNDSISAINNGSNYIDLGSQISLEVNGDIVSQGSNNGNPTYDTGNRFQLSDLDDSLTFLGNFFANSGANNIFAGGGNDDLYIEGNVHAENIGGLNLFDLGSGNDIMTLIGNVTAANGGKNKIDAGAGNDIIHLNGHIDAGALQIDGGEGNDTLILTASTLSRFEANYKDWLVDLSSSGLLASNIETIRLDVRNVQPNKIGWLTDLVNQANADGANITLEDKNGNVITEPQLGLAADSGSANAFSIMADQHSADSASARDFANDNYNAAFDQHAQTALIV